MKAALEKPRVPATAATSLDKMLLWGAMEVFRDKLDALTAMTTSAAEQHVSDVTLAPPSFFSRFGKGTVKPLEIFKEDELESELPVESLSAKVESVTFPVEEPLVERDPLPKPEPEGGIWAAPDGRSKKKKRKGKAAEAAGLVSETSTTSDEPVAFPVEEPLLMKEPLVEEKPLPEPEAEVLEGFGKKDKKDGEKVRSTIAVLASSPIAEGWVAAESDSF